MGLRSLRITEVRCKTILNRSVQGFADYTLNAYQGCGFGCSYCYVPVLRRRHGLQDEAAWGEWVLVKVNAPDVLRREMLRIPPDKRLAIGTASDAWQPLEKRYRIARRILEELSYYPNRVSILTRSPLLLRDIDVLQRMANVSVGVSLPAVDERVRRIFEPFAPALPSRFYLIRKLVAAGLRVSIFWCPILTGVCNTPLMAEAVMRQAAALHVDRVVCGTLNYGNELGRPYRERVEEFRRRFGVKGPLLAPAAMASEVSKWANVYGVKASL
ncbi:MAG: SPL family radical SAM protein [Chthonomonadales bacterium]